MLLPLARRHLSRGSAAEVVVHQGKYTYGNLRLWRDRIYTIAGRIADKTSLSIDERENRIRIGLTTLDAATQSRALVASLGIPSDAITLFEEARDTVLQTHGDLNLRERPLQGGLLINSGVGGCTLGFVVGADFVYSTWGILTASHCTPRFGPDTSQVYQPSTAYAAVGVETADPVWSTSATDPRCSAGYICRDTDAAFYTLHDQGGDINAFDPGMVYRTPFGSTAIYSTPGGRSWLPRGLGGAAYFMGDNLTKVGRTTGTTSGTVDQVCGTRWIATGAAAPASGIQLYCAGHLTGINSGPGDSGAPVFAITDPALYYITPKGVLSAGSNGNSVTFTDLDAIQWELGFLRMWW
jgi:hypothetical protein